MLKVFVISVLLIGGNNGAPSPPEMGRLALLLQGLFHHREFSFISFWPALDFFTKSEFEIVETCQLLTKFLGREWFNKATVTRSLYLGSKLEKTSESSCYFKLQAKLPHGYATWQHNRISPG